MFFKVAIFFTKRLLIPVAVGIVSCVLLAALLTTFSEKLYDFIPTVATIIFCLGAFISSKICVNGIKRSRLLLGLLCSFTFSAISSFISIFIFHDFLFSKFLIKFSLAIIFGLLGSLKRKNRIKKNNRSY